jgi:hypothetical protein
VKIAPLTEGVSEFRAMPALYEQIHARIPNTLQAPLKINVAPDASPAVVARECRSRLLIAAANGAELAIVILDREEQQECPGLIAARIEAQIALACNALPTRVVLKNSMFENWLVADLKALEQQRARFTVTAGMHGRVAPNKADNCDALALLKSAVNKGQYDKVADAQRILRRMDLANAANNSRSLRHLLHVLDDPAFATSESCKAG